MNKIENIEDRFWRYVNAGAGCWNWLAAPDSKGYGRFTIRQVRMAAHRFMYELMIGPIPDGLQLDHLCRNRMCVRPDHLEPVTQQENLHRGDGPAGINHRKAHCLHGHELHSFVASDRRHPRRRCRECDRLTHLALRRMT